MSLVTTDDFTDSLYAEVITTVDRDGDDLLQAAIDTAEEEIKDMISNRYNVATDFAKSGTARNRYLMKLIKDLAVWEFLKVSSALTNTDYWDRRQQDARRDLLKIHDGRVIPASWTLLTTPVNAPNTIEVVGSRTQRDLTGL